MKGQSTVTPATVYNNLAGARHEKIDSCLRRNDANINIALAGNPNCGKTAIFNALTGSRQKVGNWPGVTVAHKSGNLTYRGDRLQITDLPGIYSTSMADDAALDEKVTCDYLLSGQVDMIVNVVDASNLERHLYLTLQLLEMRIPVILAVNMHDMLIKKGITLDVKKLSEFLNCPVVCLVARENKGIEDLKKQIVKSYRAWKIDKDCAPCSLFSPWSHYELPVKIKKTVNELSELTQSEWLAQRLIENDRYAMAQISEEIKNVVQDHVVQLTRDLNEEPELIIADQRYQAVHKISQTVYTIVKTKRQSLTQMIDKVVLNKYLGLPIFLFMMYLMFVIAINIGGAFQDFFDISSQTIFVGGLTQILQNLYAPSWAIAILASGLGVGINTVVTFIPVLAMMFVCLAFLEDSGYMARAAFVMDRLMRALGLPGKSFVPMIVGFGCNVPAVMGARSLANRRDRVLTIMMMPFMSCGARLAIFTVFASAFFPRHGAEIIFLLYITGILVAVLTGFVLRKTILTGDPAPLIMELPLYHAPKFIALALHAWQRLKQFVFRAGKVIIPVCVLLGVLNSLTTNGELVQQGSTQSLLSATGRLVTPVFEPMGVGQNNWPATVGLATGVLAKEVVIGTLNSLYTNAATPGQFDFMDGLKQAFLSVPQNLASLGAAFVNPFSASEAPHEMNQSAYGAMQLGFGSVAAAFSYLLFVLLYFPCISTMAAIKREVSARWAYFSVLWCTAIAYSFAVIIYQLLTLFVHPYSSLSWIAAMILILAAGIFSLIFYARDKRELVYAARH